ncbi:carbon monoxide dehydrogenase [Halochromatium salexigens]|uniref:carbon monoxide dehydrogenase n=1 Tax=Halochromatium salexigens TaxID=49447 RepID=UPI001F5D8D7D|nr:carbon monoxide dehydrogenase [Halochromatium salexigens]
MSRSQHGMQRQRHGVTKNLVEGVGGVIVGAALVVFASQWFKRRQQRGLATEPAEAEALLAERPATAADAPRTANTPGD